MQSRQSGPGSPPAVPFDPSPQHSYYHHAVAAQELGVPPPSFAAPAASFGSELVDSQAEVIRRPVYFTRAVSPPRRNRGEIAVADTRGQHMEEDFAWVGAFTFTPSQPRDTIGYLRPENMAPNYNSSVLSSHQAIGTFYHSDTANLTTNYNTYAQRHENERGAAPGAFYDPCNANLATNHNTYDRTPERDAAQIHNSKPGKLLCCF